jgi:hypothetical protein
LRVSRRHGDVESSVRRRLARQVEVVVDELAPEVSERRQVALVPDFLVRGCAATALLMARADGRFAPGGLAMPSVYADAFTNRRSAVPAAPQFGWTRLLPDPS